MMTSVDSQDNSLKTEIETLQTNWTDVMHQLINIGSSIARLGEKATVAEQSKTSTANEGLIKLDDGSFVTKEWLMVSLVQQRRSNRRMEEELSSFRDTIEAHQQIHHQKQLLDLLQTGDESSFKETKEAMIKLLQPAPLGCYPAGYEKDGSDEEDDYEEEDGEIEDD